MSKFEIGDRVETRPIGATTWGEIEATGVVEEVLQACVRVLRDDNGKSYDKFYENVRRLRDDKVNHPDHYKWLPVEAIEITKHFNFCLGNALKYIIRADHKGTPIEDLKKARWYIDKEISEREMRS